MNNKNITINDLQSLLKKLKSISYFLSSDNVSSDASAEDNKILLSKTAINQSLSDLQAMIENRISDINDASTSSSTETYSINKILELLSAKQNNVIFSATQPENPKNYMLWVKVATNPVSFILHVYTTTYGWVVINDLSTQWNNIQNKPFSTIGDTFQVVDGKLDVKEDGLMKSSIYASVDNQGNVKKSDESLKISGVDDISNSYYYGKDKDGNIGFVPIKAEVEQLVVTFAEQEDVDYEKNKIVNALTL